MPVRPKTFKPQYTAPPASDDRVRGSRHARGYDAEWVRLRSRYLADYPICQVGGPNCTLAATLVDHRQPIAIAPTRRLDWSNLRSSCRPCHADVTANFKTTGLNELAKVL